MPGLLLKSGSSMCSHVLHEDQPHLNEHLSSAGYPSQSPVIHLVILLVSQGSCNKVPPMGWLKTTEIYSLTLLEITGPNQAVSRAMVSLRPWAESFLTSS